jgi:hypothetical protein
MSLILRRFIICLAALLSPLWLSGCDPCRDLAEKLCDCMGKNEIRIRQCKENLNLAKSHKFFDIAKDPKICEQVFQKCPCEKLLDQEDQECGSYRLAMPE